MADRTNFDAALMARRIAEAVRSAGGASAVSRRIGMPLSTLNRYMSGRSEPSAGALALIARDVGISIDELVGASYVKNETNNILPIEFKSEPGVSKSTDPDLVMIPYLSIRAAAGSGAQNGETEVIDRLPFSRSVLRRLGVNPSKVEFVHGAGDSMEPTIRDGSPVLVDRSKRDVKEDAIYAFSIGEDVRLKRFRWNVDGSLILISDNKDIYPPESLTFADAQQLKIHGRVFWTERVL